MVIPRTKKEPEFKDPDNHFLEPLAFSLLRNKYLIIWTFLTIYAFVTLLPAFMRDDLSREVRLIIAMLMIYPVGIQVMLFDPIWRGLVDQWELERGLR